MAKRSGVKLLERPRNRLTLVAVTLKGGAHGKTEKAERRADHQQTQRASREAWSSRGDGFHFCLC
ncbi:hypothetical protein EV700_0264 [Fluviicoccus keumensis]|uniref:Uncharacterized protein n=1 Tax=Fluviicoccus keumensis TaxID=1435465 RepID=A0A4Q7ZBT7_9GAMM|nr:hypothetical protein EV700_0264 [Fluviicoccus keumensis]